MPRNESPIFGAFRSPTEAELAALSELVRECAPAVFGAINKALNKRGMCINIDTAPNGGKLKQKAPDDQHGLVLAREEFASLIAWSDEMYTDEEWHGSRKRLRDHDLALRVQVDNAEGARDFWQRRVEARDAKDQDEVTQLVNAIDAERDKALRETLGQNEDLAGHVATLLAGKTALLPLARFGWEMLELQRYGGAWPEEVEEIAVRLGVIEPSALLGMDDSDPWPLTPITIAALKALEGDDAEST